ncbi:MAG: hypothetical protein HQM12_23625 [SAR324 cluster bacterium]|nr:hypothetical protein [SAR324 cluster bacterium]MBF0353553.1 hypothetical protein [SAR324 cluster bacterium]
MNFLSPALEYDRIDLNSGVYYNPTVNLDLCTAINRATVVVEENPFHLKLVSGFTNEEEKFQTFHAIHFHECGIWVFMDEDTRDSVFEDLERELESDTLE